MGNYKIEEIAVDDLLLDVRNPRHDIKEKQIDTLAEIMLDQKRKLLKLAKDIADSGPNPSELPIVTPYQDQKGKYIVVEGNRRLAAIQILCDPTLSSMGYDIKDVNLFKRYGEIYKNNKITKLLCVVFNQRDEADHWIDIRHNGENEGRGIVKWGAKEKARFNAQKGKPQSAYQVLEFVRQNTDLTEEELQALKKPNLTSIQRLIDDPYVRDTLGIDLIDGYITTNLPPGEIINGLTKLVLDFATQRKTVDDIRHKKERANYISEFETEILPDTNSITSENWKLQSQSSPVNPRVPQKGKLISKIGKKSVPLSTSRPTLIPSSCVLRIKNANRINKIYRELRDLEIGNFENACAITFRVFLELSVEQYSKQNGIEYHEEEHLVNTIRKVAKYMEKNKYMSTDELKPIRLACSTPDNLVSTNTLNSYVHNPNINPKANDLKITWDEFEKFFKTMWS